MTWITVVLLVAAGALGLWWLERPLRHRVKGLSEIESFLKHLLSPSYPASVMTLGRRDLSMLRFSRLRDSTGEPHLQLMIGPLADEVAETTRERLKGIGFSSSQLSLEYPGSKALLRIHFGDILDTTAAEAAQAARIALVTMGTREDEQLFVHYSKMDSHVVRPQLENLQETGGVVGRSIAKLGLKHFRKS